MRMFHLKARFCNCPHVTRSPIALWVMKIFLWSFIGFERYTNYSIEESGWGPLIND